MVKDNVQCIGDLPEDISVLGHCYDGTRVTAALGINGTIEMEKVNSNTDPTTALIVVSVIGGLICFICLYQCVQKLRMREQGLRLPLCLRNSIGRLSNCGRRRRGNNEFPRNQGEEIPLRINETVLNPSYGAVLNVGSTNDDKETSEQISGNSLQFVRKEELERRFSEVSSDLTNIFRIMKNENKTFIKRYVKQTFKKENSLLAGNGSEEKVLLSDEEDLVSCPSVNSLETVREKV